MNLALYGLRSGNEREWLCVDMGISFADAEVPGIDIILPDVQFLEKERKHLKGIVLTHGHEDHVGAMYDLWPVSRRRCSRHRSRRRFWNRSARWRRGRHPFR